jgi:hypothetical protein
MVRYGRDGYCLPERVHEPAAPGWLRELPAVQAPDRTRTSRLARLDSTIAA